MLFFLLQLLVRIQQQLETPELHLFVWIKSTCGLMPDKLFILPKARMSVSFLVAGLTIDAVKLDSHY